MSNVIIIGNGPAGVSASLYTARAGVETTIIGSGLGALGKAEKIENYYGFAEPVDAKELVAAGIAQAKRAGVNYIEDADFAAEAKKLREAGADAIIAYMHWGREYRREANDEQRAITERLLAAGVDVILGSHPHVVQPAGMREVTLADGTKHEALVAYSLGNFFSSLFGGKKS